MATKYKTYTPEFKLQAVQTIAEQQLSVAEAARRLGIAENLLHEWKKAVRNKGSNAFLRSRHREISDGVLRQPVDAIYAWIDAHRTEYPLLVMCRVLGVSRSGFYVWAKRDSNETSQRREDLGS